MRAALLNKKCSDSQRSKAIQSIALQGSENVRKGAAQDWGKKWLTSRNLVKALAADPKPSVRKALARNSSCPHGLYEQLVNDKDPVVRMAAGLNAEHPVNVRLIKSAPTSSPWFWAQLAKAEAKFPGITAAVEQGNFLFPAPRTSKALRSSSLLGRIIALSQPDAAPEELARASGYRDWCQRLAIARNPMTPQQILKKLSKDSNRYVAAQAAKTLRGDAQRKHALDAKIRKASKKEQQG